MLPLLLLLLLLLPHTACGVLKAKCPLNLKEDKIGELNYYSPGDHLISGLLSTSGAMSLHRHMQFDSAPFVYLIPIVHSKFWHILSFMFSIHEINQNPRLLPNITLGYNIYETLSSQRLTCNATVDLTSAEWKGVPNYHCGGQNNPLAVLEGAVSDISTYISNILSIYKIPQVTYGSGSQITQDKTQLPFFYRMIPKEEIYLLGIVKLLLHFQWTWIGLIVPDTDNGEKFVRIFVPLMTSHGICVAIPQNIQGDTAYFMTFLRAAENIAFFLMQKNVSVIVYYGDSLSMFVLGFLKRANETINTVMGKIWIIIHWRVITINSVREMHYIHGSLSVFIQTQKRQTYDNYDAFFTLIKQFGEEAFTCSFSKYA